jgi:rare lipoprotein A
MKFVIRFAYLATTAVLVASCGGNRLSDASNLPTRKPAPSGPVISDSPLKIGAPYKIGDVLYVPEDAAAYDDVGYASFYGDELSGQPTANGEIFLPAAVYAAHKTLPLPSYAEVTALDTGRTILVRINDRGPFANDRIIDLSIGAARQLGITGQGVTGVRVRKVNPPEQERAALRNNQTVTERIETPDSLLRVLRTKLEKLPRPSAAAKSQPQNAPARVTTDSLGGRFIREGEGAAKQNPSVSRQAQAPAPPKEPQGGRFIREGGNTATATATAKTTVAPISGAYVVQLASFSSRTRADSLARKIGATVQSSGNLFRVRYGPYASEEEAQRGLATARQRGYPQAQIFRE